MRGRFYSTYEMLAQTNKATLIHEGALGMRIWFYDHGPKAVFAIVQPTAKAERVTRGNHCRFGSFERRDEWAQEQLQNAKEHAERRQAEREKALAHVTELVAGDIMVSSWGYEQTNVSFAQIIAILPSGKTARVRRIGSDLDREKSNSSMSSYVVAKKDAFLPNEPEIVVRISPRDTFKLKGEHAAYFKWSGNPQYCSWYA